ncbi:sugar O-acetyltransferase [bacterium]|nr:sugar O-acetyltransferase [bacterium]
MSEREKMIKGEEYFPQDSELTQDRIKAKIICAKYNSLSPEQKEEKYKILKSLFGKIGDDCVVEPNFFCDYGYNIEFDGFVYINHNSVFLDCAKISIGHGTFIGPNCGFYTPTHPLEYEKRITGVEIAKPIKIGQGVWIGGNVTILAGVTIGDRAVIGAGSVVTKDIPNDVVAVGNPCKVIKKIANSQSK